LFMRFAGEDTNFITKNQLGEIMVRYASIALLPADLDEIFTRLDVTRRGKVTVDEFHRGVLGQEWFHQAHSPSRPVPRTPEQPNMNLANAAWRSVDSSNRSSFPQFLSSVSSTTTSNNSGVSSRLSKVCMGIGYAEREESKADRARAAARRNFLAQHRLEMIPADQMRKSNTSANAGRMLLGGQSETMMHNSMMTGVSGSFAPPPNGSTPLGSYLANPGHGEKRRW
jgi:hypothetical protein